MTRRERELRRICTRYDLPAPTTNDQGGRLLTVAASTPGGGDPQEAKT